MDLITTNYIFAKHLNNIGDIIQPMVNNMKLRRKEGMTPRKFNGLALAISLVFLVIASAFVGLFGERVNAEIDETWHKDSSIVVSIVGLEKNMLIRTSDGNYSTATVELSGIDGGARTIDWVECYWGDGSYNTSTNTSVTFYHQYTEVGIYTVTLKAGNTTDKAYNEATATIGIWNHTVSGIITLNGTPVNPSEMTLTGRVVGVSATDVEEAYYQFNNMAFKIGTVTAGTNRYKYTVYLNNGKNIILGYELFHKTKERTRKGELYRDDVHTGDTSGLYLFGDVYTAEPVYINLTPSDPLRVDYTGDDYATAAIDIKKVDQNDREVMQTFHGWNTKYAEVKHIWRSDVAYYRMYIECMYAMLYPDLFTYDQNITEQEQTYIIAYQQAIIDLMKEMIQFPPTTENYFYLDNEYFILTDDIDIIDVKGLVGAYTYNNTNITYDGIDTLAMTIRLILKNDNATFTGDTHKARWLMWTEDNERWNTTYALQAPQGWYIYDYSYMVLGYTWYNESTDTVYYQPLQVRNANNYTYQWIEVTMKKIPVEEGEEEEEEEGAGGVVEEEEAPWYEWFYDNWIWLVIIGGIVVLAYVLLRRP